MSRGLFLISMALLVWPPSPNGKAPYREAVTGRSTETEPELAPASADRRDAATERVDGGDSAAITRATRGVIQGVHDFSAITGNAIDVCSACHVPHLQTVRPADRSGNKAVLELFRIQGQREVFEPGRYMPGASSLICLSCHNGTVASSTIGTSHALFSESLESRFGLQSLSIRDHPIGVPYPNGRKGYRPLAAILARGTLPMPDGRIECISCHDPHNAAGVDNLLVMSNRRSALCLACHEK